MGLTRAHAAMATVAATMLLAACGSDRLSLGDASTGATSAQGLAVDMVGRWMLAASNAPPCGMTFGGDRAKGEGTIAPEGGCPGQFFKSRRWTFEDDALVIKDHNGETLGRLTFAGNGFDGTAVGGQPITLSR